MSAYIYWGTPEHRFLIPELSYSAAKAKYADSDAWHLFARQITRNPFVQDYLQKRQAHRCPWCALSVIGNIGIQIHHIDYDHVCGFGQTIVVQRLTRKATVPDCRSCMTLHPELFQSCMKRLRLIHGRCNRQIALVSSAMND
jgi:hypothetical protein